MLNVVSLVDEICSDLINTPKYIPVILPFACPNIGYTEALIDCDDDPVVCNVPEPILRVSIEY